MRRRAFLTATCAAALASVPADTQSPAAKSVVASMFGAQAPLPIAIGQEKGLFEKYGVRVVADPKWTSQELRDGLASGAFQVIHSLVDNAVAVAEQSGVPTIIIMGSGDSSSNSELLVQPHIKTADDLRGKTVLVDSPDTAMALALRKILRLKGLEAGRDYTMKPFAQTAKRFEAMLANKEYAGTMMALTPEAGRLGFHSIGSIAEAIGPYQGSGVYVTRKWAEANPDAVVGYLAGYLAAQRWLRSPANREEVIARLVKASTADAARQTYERTYAAGRDLTPDPGFDVEAFKNVLKLRAEIEGTWGGKPPAPERYYDLSYFQKALALIER